MKQVQEKLNPIFKILHPGMCALMLFDNSMNHRERAPDALVAKRLNLGDGGKNVAPRRDGWYKMNFGEIVFIRCRMRMASKKC